MWLWYSNNAVVSVACLKISILRHSVYLLHLNWVPLSQEGADGKLLSLRVPIATARGHNLSHSMLLERPKGAKVPVSICCLAAEKIVGHGESRHNLIQLHLRPFVKGQADPR